MTAEKNGHLNYCRGPVTAETRLGPTANDDGDNDDGDSNVNGGDVDSGKNLHSMNGAKPKSSLYSQTTEKAALR